MSVNISNFNNLIFDSHYKGFASFNSVSGASPPYFAKPFTFTLKVKFIIINDDIRSPGAICNEVYFI